MLTHLYMLTSIHPSLLHFPHPSPLHSFTLNSKLTFWVNIFRHRSLTIDTSDWLPPLMGPFSVSLSLSVLSRVFGAVDKTSSSFSAHGKIGNFIIIVIIVLMRCVLFVDRCSAVLSVCALGEHVVGIRDGSCEARRLWSCHGGDWVSSRHRRLWPLSRARDVHRQRVSTSVLPALLLRQPVIIQYYTIQYCNLLWRPPPSRRSAAPDYQWE